MNRIDKAFTNKKAFIPFITLGDPNLETSYHLILEMANNGADIIELGIPFSDPVAEGPTIQKSSERALKNNISISKIFELVIKIRKEIETPLIFMTYMNIIYKFGKQQFVDKCKEIGIDGLIIVDLPYEEREELAPFCDDNDIYLISLITPTSTDRIERIVNSAKGFLYCVSSMGVTGERKDINLGITDLIQKVKSISDIPCAIGFGISNKNQAQTLAPYCDGIIVGSTIVRIIEKLKNESVKEVANFTREMKAAIN